MTTVDDLWYLADEAAQRAERTYHRLAETHDGYMEFTIDRSVSRSRFRTVAGRIRENGLPYGSHTLAYRPDGRLLLVRHADVDMWVLPGGEVDDGETFREGANRELHEEAGIDAEYEGLGILARVDFHCDDHHTWGVLPIYEGEATDTDVTVADPDGEITDAHWFETLPKDTRDREHLLRWHSQRFE
ncbi:MAG: NUDIX hydrolase [Haloarculaceae archaeon]